MTSDQLFSDDNTTGYTQAERDALNAEWDAIVEAENLESHTDAWDERADQFTTEVAKR